MVRERFEKVKSWRPSLGLMIAVLIVAGGVAFALFQSQAKLTGNSIHTEGALLLISQNDSNYGTATPGYDFSGIIPGTQASQTEHFFLKNSGTTPVNLSIGVMSAPYNPNGVDLSKVNVILTPYSTTTFMPGTPQSFSLQSLVAAAGNGIAVIYPDKLDPGAKEEFNVQVSMDAAATGGTAAVSLSSIDLAFTGVAITGSQ